MAHMREPTRTYDRSWADIENMLDAAKQERRLWEMRFERAVKAHNTQAKKDCARNAKALEGVIKTLKWVLGEQGIDHPLE